MKPIAVGKECSPLFEYYLTPAFGQALFSLFSILRLLLAKLCFR